MLRLVARGTGTPADGEAVDVKPLRDPTAHETPSKTQITR